MSLIIALKQLDSISFENTDNEKVLISKLEQNQENLLIIDADFMTEDLIEFKTNHSNTKVIGLSDTQEKNEYFDYIVPKLVTVDILVKLFKQ